MPGRDQRDRTWTHGQRDATLRIHRLNKKGPPARLDDPTVEQLRECIRDGYCWWCDSGPWKVLAGHTSKAHGITAAELRRLAYLYKDTSICSPEHRYACTQRPQTIHLSPKFVRKAGVPRVLSERGRIEATARLIAVSNDDQRRKAGQKAARKTRKPHPCPVCGTMLPTAHPITCSPECRKVVRQRTMGKANTPDVREKAAATFSKHYAEGRFQISGGAKPHPCPVCSTLVPKARPIACSPECRHVLLQRAAAKGKVAQQRLLSDPERKAAWAKKISEAHGGREEVTCDICGTGFTAPRWLHRRVCSRDCLLELRRRNALRNNVSKRPEVRAKISEKVKARKMPHDSLGRFTSSAGLSQLAG